MEWRDEGLILGVRRHGETSAIVELMTRSHGRHLGLVRGGRSSSLRPLLQAGNSVSALWRARLEDHLGHYQLEAESFRAASLMDSSHGLFLLQTLVSHLRLLPERDSHEGLYNLSCDLLDSSLALESIGELLVRFELALLRDLGFGLDLVSCAATGVSDDLVYVSPKSGRAVSSDAGSPYSSRLLKLPSFLVSSDSSGISDTSASSASSDFSDISSSDILDGFRLTGWFFERHVHGPRSLSLPIERDRLVNFFLVD